MGGAASRRKGHNFEREIARELREVFGPQVRRGLQYQDGACAPDVLVPLFHVECKRGARTNIGAALRQAEGDAAAGKWPLAICRNDHEDATATMRWEDFKELLVLAGLGTRN